jgi:hypothetical protein
VIKSVNRLFAALLFASASSAHAQLTNDFIQNNSYWGDGKAEFNIYDAQIVRDGQPRPCEVTHILVREAFDPKQFVKQEGQPRPDAIAVLKLNQILHIPTGLYFCQQMHSNFWRVDNGQLVKFSLSSNDSIGNAYKEARRAADVMSYEYRTYSDGMSTGSEPVALPQNTWFYDELAFRVRTFDFRKPNGATEVQLGQSVINSKKDKFEFKPAKLSFVSTEKSINVTVQHAGGTDQFRLDSQFPYLLREWTAADGSHLKMKRNLKVDYWNYGKNGDRERAFNNPMLRMPD